VSEPRRAGGLFIGELSRENGIDLLREALALFPGARIELIPDGKLEGERLQARLERAAYLVLPAPCAEPVPRRVMEAFANALPVIAADDGSAAALVEPGRNGLLFDTGSARDLARRLAWAEAFPEKMRQMGACARADYLARFIADWSYRRLFGERRRSARR
jgi:glycosyltransferase involved in cell wall biosynthesis